MGHGILQETHLGGEPSNRTMGDIQRLNYHFGEKMENVTIESNSLVAINLINEDFDGCHPQSNMIFETKALKTRMGATLIHISRSANECADHLARLGAEQNDHLVVLDVMPLSLSLREFWNRDRLGLRHVLD